MPDEASALFSLFEALVPVRDMIDILSEMTMDGDQHKVYNVRIPGMAQSPTLAEIAHLHPKSAQFRVRN